jgi:hypothetical protein
MLSLKRQEMEAAEEAPVAVLGSISGVLKQQ